MMTTPDYLVVGAGIFGVTAALALRRRGRLVSLIDPGPVPHPLAATTDISKAIRMEYGSDETYMIMMEDALGGWRQWNETMDAPLFHETGVTMLTRAPMAVGGFEYESYRMLLARGHRPERLDSAAIARRFPAWNSDVYVDGFYHAQGGYAESGRLLAALTEQAAAAGVELLIGDGAASVRRENSRVTGVRTQGGADIAAGQVVVAAGAWTPKLVPELAGAMRATGHPVFHLRPPDPALFSDPAFVVFTADIARSGWYGFPVHPQEGVVKIANHGVGVELDPETDERVVYARDEAALRGLLAETFPALRDAPIVYTRRCMYCDTRDEHFWIDRHPEVAGLTVAAGGSGHGFKFAPLLGDLIADAAEGADNPWLAKFRWRDLSGRESGEEAARFHG
jgi:glycine/D-amino acid oxidase-like deaminating enzyme